MFARAQGQSGGARRDAAGGGAWAALPQHRVPAPGTASEASSGVTTPVDQTSPHRISILRGWGTTQTGSFLFPLHKPVPSHLLHAAQLHQFSHRHRPSAPPTPRGRSQPLGLSRPTTPPPSAAVTSRQALQHERDQTFPKLNAERMEQSEFPRLAATDESLGKEPLTNSERCRSRNTSFLGTPAGCISSPDLFEAGEDVPSFMPTGTPRHEAHTNNITAGSPRCLPSPRIRRGGGKKNKHTKQTRTCPAPSARPEPAHRDFWS